VSMVTLYYLRRFLDFFDTIFDKSSIQEITISKELAAFFIAVANTFEEHLSLLEGAITDKQRKIILDGLGQAGSTYRESIYQQSFSGKKETISVESLKYFIKISQDFLEHSIKANKRSDQLYHAYNLMTVENKQEVSIAYLSEMLEGQVAVLSSGALSSKEVLAVLDGLKNSQLFRKDQYTYLLYPNKDLLGFLTKNTIPSKAVDSNPLLQALLEKGNSQLIEKDVRGQYHFNGSFRNANDVKQVLEQLSKTEYAPLVEKDSAGVLQTFEEVFNHKAFTGRSGTFFGYEGLGSTYWHMVSKLALAVQECCLKAIDNKENEEVINQLINHYYQITEGIGVHKPPTLYGAFPTDPYSHTPYRRGAQQPGMTGQVKEDILCRFGELGISIKNGSLDFHPLLLKKEEFLNTSNSFEFVDVQGHSQQLALPKQSLCFTYCQIPIIYQLSDKNGIEVVYSNNSSKTFSTMQLDAATSKEIFERTGKINSIHLSIKNDFLIV